MICRALGYVMIASVAFNERCRGVEGLKGGRHGVFLQMIGMALEERAEGVELSRRVPSFSCCGLEE